MVVLNKSVIADRLMPNRQVIASAVPSSFRDQMGIRCQPGTLGALNGVFEEGIEVNLGSPPIGARGVGSGGLAILQQKQR